MPDVYVEHDGRLGRIRLNRPKALNSLTLDMVTAIASALDDFAADAGIAAVLVTGEGERGFCAGGDIRAIFETGRAGDGAALNFFRQEYRMNARIARFEKPYVAIMDGITMGGGVGLSAHGKVRIVTDRTRLAMPETGIGFFPDVGATWLLPRAPGEAGTYLGLTGEPVGAADAIHAGLADVQVAADAVPALIAALTKGADDVPGAIAPFVRPTAPTDLQTHARTIDRIFAAEDVASILARLEGSDVPFLLEAAGKLRTRSPTSLKLTLALLRLGRSSASLEDCLAREFTACHGILAGHDFYEGVRAAVIDKDRNPRWSPAALDDVSEADIAAYLRPAAAGLWEDQP